MPKVGSGKGDEKITGTGYKWNGIELPWGAATVRELVLWDLFHAGFWE